jgi:outer membrane receptor protein involved in Fe transport
VGKLTTTIEIPASKEVDARNRAARTFLQGLLVDVVAAAVVVLLPAVTGLQWTPLWWAALGLAVAKSVVVAIVSYVARKTLPPSVGATTGEELEDDDSDTQAVFDSGNASGGGGYV